MLEINMEALNDQHYIKNALFPQLYILFCALEINYLDHALILQVDR